MSAKWQPGDVAIVRNRWGVENVAICSLAASVRGFVWKYGVSDSTDLVDDPARDARRIVVIDPEDREQVGRLADELVRIGIADGLLHSDVAKALRALASPNPPIEVPIGLGAVVEDAKGTKFVRVAEAFDGWAAGCDWQRIGGEINSVRNFGWSQINAVRVLSEGVTA